jgi:hypothetical protein
LRQTAASAVNQAEQAARDAADARSPSRVFARLGVDMGAGVIVGLRDMVQPLVRQTADLATASIDTFARYQFDPMFASMGGGTSYSQPVPVASNRLNGNAGGGGNTFVVMTRSELADMFEAADVVKVLTTPEEITAAWGR